MNAAQLRLKAKFDAFKASDVYKRIVTENKADRDAFKASDEYKGIVHERKTKRPKKITIGTNSYTPDKALAYVYRRTELIKCSMRKIPTHLIPKDGEERMIWTGNCVYWKTLFDDLKKVLMKIPESMEVIMKVYLIDAWCELTQTRQDVLDNVNLAILEADTILEAFP